MFNGGKNNKDDIGLLALHYACTGQDEASAKLGKICLKSVVWGLVFGFCMIVLLDLFCPLH